MITGIFREKLFKITSFLISFIWRLQKMGRILIKSIGLEITKPVTENIIQLFFPFVTIEVLNVNCLDSVHYCLELLHQPGHKAWSYSSWYSQHIKPLIKFQQWFRSSTSRTFYLSFWFSWIFLLIGTITDQKWIYIYWTTLFKFFFHCVSTHYYLNFPKIWLCGWNFPSKFFAFYTNWCTVKVMKMPEDTSAL